MLKPGSDPDEGDEALKYYANHTAQIEVEGCSLKRKYCSRRHIYFLLCI